MFFDGSASRIPAKLVLLENRPLCARMSLTATSSSASSGSSGWSAAALAPWQHAKAATMTVDAAVR